MRGKEKRIISFTFDLRIPPAYAGKRPVVAAVLNRVRDHPRLCGEKFVKSFKHVRTPGSPPPMRGKARLATRKASPTGITPAYAGKSTHAGKLRESSKDHPRLCGEKNSSRPLERRHTGSPPPMRGKAYRSCTGAGGKGITPAYAGKRFRFLCLAVRCKDHPRLCGEKISWIISGMLMSGSPPPMRGKDCVFVTLRLDGRITPAYAGKRKQRKRSSETS